MADLIAKYTLELSSHLRGFWPQRRRIVEEVRVHLEEAAENASGSPAEAQAQAIEAFGPAGMIAKRFAEERLEGAMRANTPLLVGGLLLMWSLVDVERAFPVAPVFHAAPPPFTQWMVTLGWTLQFVAVPLLVLSFGLRSRRRFEGSVLAWAMALCALVIGPGCISFGHAMGSMAAVGAAARAPLIIRAGLGIALFFASTPALTAADAYGATLRAAR